MSRDKILNTKTSNSTASRLKNIMLRYHDHRLQPALPLGSDALSKLTNWQSSRLIQSHYDLYSSPDYQQGLKFLFTDLYSDEDFSHRDRDLERIFPKMVKLLPKGVLETVTLLIELNFLTQRLDQQLAHTLFNILQLEDINEHSYCLAYRHCNNFEQRLYQIQLTSELGNKLDKYARSSMINFTLKISETPAEMAGLSALHNFLMTGFSAFHSMRAVKPMMQTLTERETKVLQQIYDEHPQPFSFS